MKKYLVSALSLFLLAAAGMFGGFGPLTSSAATAPMKPESLATATFAVEKMTCGTCPITVKTAMSRVEGVRSVEVDFEKKTATVVYDPTVASPDAIAAASTNAGYPAKPVAPVTLNSE